MTTKQTLGVCYYPEHWNPAKWREDAQMMAAAGITFVRIGEFAWSRMEPNPGGGTRFCFTLPAVGEEELSDAE